MYIIHKNQVKIIVHHQTSVEHFRYHSMNNKGWRERKHFRYIHEQSSLSVTELRDSCVASANTQTLQVLFVSTIMLHRFSNAYDQNSFHKPVHNFIRYMYCVLECTYCQNAKSSSRTWLPVAFHWEASFHFALHKEVINAMGKVSPHHDPSSLPANMRTETDRTCVFTVF